MLPNKNISYFHASSIQKVPNRNNCRSIRGNHSSWQCRNFNEFNEYQYNCSKNLNCNRTYFVYITSITLVLENNNWKLTSHYSSMNCFKHKSRSLILISQASIIVNVYILRWLNPRRLSLHLKKENPTPINSLYNIILLQINSEIN